MGIKKINMLTVIVILFCLTSCQIFFGEDDELTIKREPYVGSKLNLNGYYYFKSKDGDMVYMYFLYRNGLILNAGACKVEKWADYDQNFLNKEYITIVVNLKYNWGVYQIRGNKIKFERWHPSERPFRTAIREGEILNDSTFIIKKAISSKGKETIKNEIYHFKQFNPKLDSITKYIK